MPESAVRFCARVCIGALLSLSALAQQAPPDPAAIVESLDKQMTSAVSAWLKSSDARTQAWGAYLVVRDRRQEAVPQLLEMLANYPAGEGATGDPHDAMLQVLDALIQLDAPVPLSDAQRIYAEFPVQSLILLSRSKEETSPALLSIFQSEQRWPSAWLASGNLLLQRRAKGFAAKVVEGMTVHAQITVTQPGSGGGIGGSTVCGVEAPPSPKSGWPMVGVYQFGACGQNLWAEDVVLASGPDPAAYRRVLTSNYGTTSLGLFNCIPDRDLVREHYLSALLSGGEAPVLAHVSHTIFWQDDAAYSNDMASFIAGQQQVFAELARRLGESHLLSDEEVKTLRPVLHIVILDWRSSHETALPTLQPLAANVTIDRM
jgi:hypothetical protein